MHSEQFIRDFCFSNFWLCKSRVEYDIIGIQNSGWWGNLVKDPKLISFSFHNLFKVYAKTITQYLFQYAAGAAYEEEKYFDFNLSKSRERSSIPAPDFNISHCKYLHNEGKVTFN